MQVSDVISLIAVGVAFLALGVSLLELLSNKPRLRLTLASALLSPEKQGVTFTTRPRKFRKEERTDGSIDLVAVDITNFGRQPTMIKTIEFRLSHSDKSVCPEPKGIEGDRGHTLPKELTPGKFGTFYFDASDLVVFDPATSPIPLREFAFLPDIEIAIRHSWRKAPHIFRGVV